MELNIILLVLSQTIAFIWLVASETMPFIESTPYNGIVQMIVESLKNASKTIGNSTVHSEL